MYSFAYLLRADYVISGTDMFCSCALLRKLVSHVFAVPSLGLKYRARIVLSFCYAIPGTEIAVLLPGSVLPHLRRYHLRRRCTGQLRCPPTRMLRHVLYQHTDHVYALDLRA